MSDLRQRVVHQPMDKSTKRFYGDPAITKEFLCKHLPEWIVAEADMSTLQQAPTEYIDQKLRTVRHVDLVWKVWFRDSWLYLVLLFEIQATVDWLMPVRILLETGLAYVAISKDPEVQKRRKLPPVLPIVVHIGTKPWDASTRLEDLLADEAKACLPFALGTEFLLVSEAEEARTLERADTPRTAGLKLRYARDVGEYQEAVAALKRLLPRDSPARQALVEWVRTARINDGAKEEEVEDLRTLDDLAEEEEPFVYTWWEEARREARRKALEEARRVGREEGHREGREEGHREGREEGRRAGREEVRRAGHQEGQRQAVERIAARRFGRKTASRLAKVLEGVSDPEQLGRVGDLVVDCATGDELLAEAAKV